MKYEGIPLSVYPLHPKSRGSKVHDGREPVQQIHHTHHHSEWYSLNGSKCRTSLTSSELIVERGLLGPSNRLTSKFYPNTTGPHSWSLSVSPIC